MEVRSSRRLRTLVTRMARLGLSVNEIARALISMMARSTTLQSEAGYIDARPQPPIRRNLLATHGRTIHLGQSRRFGSRSATSGSSRTTDIIRPAHLVRFVPASDIH